MAESLHVMYVLSITLSPALAQKYSSSCLGVPKRPTSLYHKVPFSKKTILVLFSGCVDNMLHDEDYVFLAWNIDTNTATFGSTYEDNARIPVTLKLILQYYQITAERIFSFLS